MESLKLSKRRSKSNNSSPRDESKQRRDSSPPIRIIGRDEIAIPRITCPRCKTSDNIVRLGIWREHDSEVYFCGLIYSNERACKNIWMPNIPYIQIDQVLMRYIPGHDGDYMVTFS